MFNTARFQLSRSNRRPLRASGWQLQVDCAFDEVIQQCAHIRRPGQHGTWISEEMIAAYCQLHRLGHAHSIEVFDGGRLVGGLFGLSFGHMVCGDSMFSAESGASSLALAALALRMQAWGWPLLDAQVPNAHTRRLGVDTWPRQAYLDALASLRDRPAEPGSWRDRFGEVAAADACAPRPA